MEHGNLIKKMRKDRKITRKELTANAGSLSSLQHFENDDAHIDFDTLWTYLKRMNIRMDEYCLRYSDYTVDRKEMFRLNFKEALQTAYAPIYLKNLEEEYQKTHDIFYKYLLLQVKAISQKYPNKYLPEQPITKEDVKFLYNYLESVEDWGYFELSMYSNCLAVFESAYLSFNYSDVLRQFKNYSTSFKHRLGLTYFLINSLTLAFERKNISQVPYLLKELEQGTRDSEFILGRIYWKFFSSLYQSIQGNFSIDVSSYEEILRSLDYENDAENMKDIRQSILNA